MLSSIETEVTLNDKQVHVTMYLARYLLGTLSGVPLMFSAGGSSFSHVGKTIRTEPLCKKNFQGSPQNADHADCVD